MAMESLTYDRVQAYAEEIPPQELETWQPRKILAFLLQIDPNADRPSTLAVGVEEVPGVPAKELTSMGSEEVLDLRTLKKHYDALGSYLHTSTLKELRKGRGWNPEKLRKRCVQIAKICNQVLASPVWNIRFGSLAILPSCSRCEANPVRVRFPRSSESVEASCFSCGAGYIVIAENDSQVRWKPRQMVLKCPNPACEAEAVIWEDEFVVGACWTCEGCADSFVLRIGIAKDLTDASSEELGGRNERS